MKKIIIMSLSKSQMKAIKGGENGMDKVVRKKPGRTT